MSFFLKEVSRLFVYSFICSLGIFLSLFYVRFCVDGGGEASRWRRCRFGLGKFIVMGRYRYGYWDLNLRLKVLGVIREF